MLGFERVRGNVAGGNSLGKAGSYPLGYYYFKGAGQKKKLLPDKENIGNVWVRKIQGIDILVIRGK